MRLDKEKAFELRRSGKSYNEIKDILNIPVSTLSIWFNKNPEFIEVLRKNQEESRRTSSNKITLMNQVRKMKLLKTYGEAREEAGLCFDELAKNPLFLTALALYWGEGDKKSPRHMRISNVEPKLVKIFILFAEKFLSIRESQIKVSLLIYPDLDANICKDYWKRGLGLSDENFYKPSIIQGRHKVNRLSYGVCSAGFSSTRLKQKILVWLEKLGDLEF